MRLHLLSKSCIGNFIACFSEDATFAVEQKTNKKQTKNNNATHMT